MRVQKTPFLFFSNRVKNPSCFNRGIFGCVLRDKTPFKIFRLFLVYLERDNCFPFGVIFDILIGFVFKTVALFINKSIYLLALNLPKPFILIRLIFASPKVIVFPFSFVL